MRSAHLVPVTPPSVDFATTANIHLVINCALRDIAILSTAEHLNSSTKLLHPHLEIQRGPSAPLLTCLELSSRLIDWSACLISIVLIFASQTFNTCMFLLVIFCVGTACFPDTIKKIPFELKDVARLLQW